MDKIHQEIPILKRRYIERQYSPSRIRYLFDIPMDEMIISLVWDSQDNRIIIKTLQDYDKDKGDL